MSQQNKEARTLKRQIRYLLRTSGGRLELGESRAGLLRSIGRFVERMKFESRDEAARTLGISLSKFDYVVKCYRKLLRTEKKPARGGKRLKLARIKIVDEPVPAKSSRPEPRPVELVLESGVRVSVASADAAIDLLDRLEQRKRQQAAA